MEPDQKQKVAVKTKFENFTYGLIKMVKYILLIAVVGFVISYLIHYFRAYNLSTVLKIVGGVLVFIGLASQLGTGGFNRDYNYNMVKMTNPDLVKYERGAAKMDENLIFMTIFAIAGLIVLGIGFLV
ncbi:MAG: hypothetical protein IBX70_07015 [Clostridia bacterium]|nr:hypothetical protein [Clostridia bacterium]